MTTPRQSSLDDWLAAARADLAQQMPPTWIESSLAARQAERAVLQRLRTSPSPSTRPDARLLRWRWAVPAALAALLLFSVVLLALGDPLPAVRDGGEPSFMAVRPLEAIAVEPQPMVITSDVPRAQLAAYGLPVDPARADQPVRAQFLVSRRGAVLAVRFSPE
jgi:hypothetical protein